MTRFAGLVSETGEGRGQILPFAVRFSGIRVTQTIRTPVIEVLISVHFARILELDNCKGTEAVSLFWVDYEGRPQEWGRVEAGEVMLYHTWAGHAWEARGTARRRRYVLPLGGADVELSAEVGVDCFE